MSQDNVLKCDGCGDRVGIELKERPSGWLTILPPSIQGMDHAIDMSVSMGVYDAATGSGEVGLMKVLVAAKGRLDFCSVDCLYQFVKGKK